MFSSCEGQRKPIHWLKKKSKGKFRMSDEPKFKRKWCYYMPQERRKNSDIADLSIQHKILENKSQLNSKERK